MILTHLHFDHAGGLGLLPDSVPVLVSAACGRRVADRPVIGGDVVHFAAGLGDQRFPIFADDPGAERRTASSGR